MLRSSLFLLLSLLLSLPTFGQQTATEREQLTLMDAVSPQKLPTRWYEISWLSEDQFIFTRDFQTMKTWENGEVSDLFTGSDLNPEGESFGPYVIGLRWESPTVATYVRENKLCRYEIGREAEVVFMWPEQAANLERGPSSQVAFTIDGNVYVANEKMEEAMVLTDDASETIIYGEAAHRSEFGITKGFFWSPMGDKVAFYRIDQGEVPPYTLVDQQLMPATTTNIYYPMAGQASQHVSIGVADLNSGEVIYLQTGEPLDHYLTNLTWSPDGKNIYLAEVNRGQDHLWLNRYDAESGEMMSTLFEETDEEYVEPEHGLYFLPESEQDFLWFSERDGWQHLYHYRTDGTLVAQVTSGEYDVTSFDGFLDSYQSILVRSRKESPLQSHLYRVDLESGNMVQLSREHGVHSPYPSPEGSMVLDAWSSTDIPWSINLLDAKKGKVREELFEAENPLASVSTGDTEIVTLAAADGTSLYGRLIKPADFDPENEYPVIVYVYGGPHVQLIEDSWLAGSSMYLQYLAQQGYVVWTLDNRGTPHRGIDFEQATFRQLGTLEIEDQMTGIQYLKSLSFVDAERIGVHGWSYGGFMTTGIMTREPGACKVGVAGGPVIDWRMYEVMYTERYMDTPAENEEGYEQSSLFQYADQLEGKLLIIHGQQDDVVIPQHSFRYIRTCVEQGVQVDYFPYPTHPHNVRGIDRIHLLEKITRYFDDYL